MTEPQQGETAVEQSDPTTDAEASAPENLDVTSSSTPEAPLATDEVITEPAPIAETPDEEVVAAPSDEAVTAEAAVEEVAAEPAVDAAEPVAADEPVEPAVAEAESVSGLSAEDLEAAPAAEPEPEPVIDNRPEPTTMEELLNEQATEIRSLKHGDVVEGNVVRIFSIPVVVGPAQPAEAPAAK